MATDPVVKVRAMGSGAVHHARTPGNLVRLRQFGAYYTGTVGTVPTLCGATIGRQAGTVVMHPTARVTCRTCRHLEAQHAD